MLSKESSGDDSLSEREKLVPGVSVLLLGAVLLIEDFDYYLIETGATLFFYAVMVQIWTELGSGELPPVKRDWQFVLFLFMAIGAVIIGLAIRESVIFLTGTIYAVQSLALGIVIGRWYVNARNSNELTFESVLRYNDPFDQRLVLIPCLAMGVLPVIASQFGFSVVDIETTRGFTGLIGVSIMLGVLYHGYETGDLEELRQELQGK